MRVFMRNRMRMRHAYDFFAKNALNVAVFCVVYAFCMRAARIQRLNNALCALHIVANVTMKMRS